VLFPSFPSVSGPPVRAETWCNEADRASLTKRGDGDFWRAEALLALDPVTLSGQHTSGVRRDHISCNTYAYFHPPPLPPYRLFSQSVNSCLCDTGVLPSSFIPLSRGCGDSHSLARPRHSRSRQRAVFAIGSARAEDPRHPQSHRAACPLNHAIQWLDLLHCHRAHPDMCLLPSFLDWSVTPPPQC